MRRHDDAAQALQWCVYSGPLKSRAVGSGSTIPREGSPCQGCERSRGAPSNTGRRPHSLPLHGQAGGSLLIHQFLPGPRFDGQDAEPNGITNFNGNFAQVYMGGHAVDSKGRTWDVDVDTRVYQGEYVGANGMHDHGTFVEI